MSINLTNLNRLLKLCGSTEKELISALRRDIADEIRRETEEDHSPRDFHSPFWSDAKGHVIGIVDLVRQTEHRVAANDRRKRLYPVLTNGFLKWFQDLRRGTNERLSWMEERVHNRYPVPGLELIIKVDNLLGLKIGIDRYRLVYPYFSEKPVLSEKWARIGLWLMSEALSDFSVTEMEILDVLRGQSYSGKSVFFKGDEEAIFARRFTEIVEERERLSLECH